MDHSLKQDEICEKTPTRDLPVPDNDIAKLMYYVQCVCTAVDCSNHPEIERFTTYCDWDSLSVDEQRQLFILCITFSPDLFEENVFVQNDILSSEYGNKFYEINQVRNQVLTAHSIIILGETWRVKRVMFYKTSWIQKNYYEPMRRLPQQFVTPQYTKGSVLFRKEDRTHLS